jgi:uncharacterized protein DUF4136
MKTELIIPRLICLASALLLSALCSSLAVAQKTSVSHDPAPQFLNYKTFMFSSTSVARNPFVNEIIVKALELELTARGLTRVEKDADLRVSYFTATGFDLQTGDVSYGYNINPAHESLIPSGVAVSDVTTGTLLISLIDKKDRMVFRAMVKDVLRRAPSPDLAADAKIVTKPIKKGVAKVFKKYPVTVR